jgi:hypothetical protein
MSFSQNNGIKTGIALSDIISNENIDYLEGVAINPSIGFFRNLISRNHYNIQIGANYLQIGSSHTSSVEARDIYNRPIGTVEITQKWDVQYIQLNLGIKPKVIIYKTIVYAIVEPSINYLISFSSTAPKSEETPFILGASIGCGSQFYEFSKMKYLFGEIRYCSDLMSFYKYYDYNISSDVKLWNTYCIFDFGVTF